MAEMDISRTHILIVDDNRFMREILRSMLQLLGARSLIEAEDGAQALERCGQHSPDIVLLDWGLPVLSGIEVLRLLRKRGTSPVPFADVIMVTAYSERSHVIEASRAGVTEYLIKPVSPKALQDRIHRCIVTPRPYVESKGYFGPIQPGMTVGVDGCRLVERPSAGHRRSQAALHG